MKAAIDKNGVTNDENGATFLDNGPTIYTSGASNAVRGATFLDNGPTIYTNGATNAANGPSKAANGITIDIILLKNNDLAPCGAATCHFTGLDTPPNRSCYLLFCVIFIDLRRNAMES